MDLRRFVEELIAAEEAARIIVGPKVEPIRVESAAPALFPSMEGLEAQLPKPEVIAPVERKEGTHIVEYLDYSVEGTIAVLTEVGEGKLDYIAVRSESSDYGITIEADGANLFPDLRMWEDFNDYPSLLPDVSAQEVKGLYNLVISNVIYSSSLKITLFVNTPKVFDLVRAKYTKRV